MKRRALSVNRTIAGMIMAGYIALLVLLLSICFFWISATQREKANLERQRLAGQVDVISEAMDMLEKHIYDTYASNRDFLKLAGVLTETENYQSAYYLQDAMQTKQALEASMHGYVLFYDRLSSCWFRTRDNGILSTDQMRQIVDQLRPIVSASGGHRSWTSLEVGGDTVLAVMCRRDNAAVAAVYNVSEVLERAAEPLGAEGGFELLGPGGALRGRSDLADRPEISERLQARDSAFEVLSRGRQVYALRLPKVNLWVALSMKRGLWDSVSLGQIALLLVTALSILAVIMLYRFLRFEFLRPIQGLTHVMEDIRDGNNTRVPILDVRFREIRQINETLSTMVSEIERQKLTIYEEIIERQKAELQFLQLQLKPHFFLNSLKTINAMAINGDNQGIQENVHAVSGHLRYLFQESHMVLLKDELSFVRNYLTIQGDVYGRQVQMEYDVAPETTDWQVPILCLQTFVENSVKYARTSIAGMPLCVSIRTDLLTTEEGRYLDIIISDNCQGYSDEVLERINRGDFGDDGQAVGIGNIIRRCRLLYGERAELRFYNDHGAISELILPELATEAGT